MVNLKANTLRRVLLAGTAIVAASAFGAGEVHAQTAVSVPAGGGTWAANGTQGDDGTLAEAVAGADVNFSVSASSLVFRNNGTADDGSGLNSFNVGTITDSGSTNNIFFEIGSANDLVVQTGAISLSADLFMLNNVDDADLTVNVTGDVQATTLNITNNNATTADALDFGVSGDVTLDVITISAGDNAGGGSTARLSVTGDATFNTSANVTGGDGNAANTATLQLGGANVAFNNNFGATLTDGAAGQAILDFNGTASGQTVSGVIQGGNAGDGLVSVTNTHSDGVTFNGTIGSGSSIDRVLVNNDGNDQAVTFANDVATTNGIELGDNTGGDTITANFGTATALQIDGAVTGGASETVNVNIIGGGTVNQNTGVWTGIDSLQITGGTTLQSGAAITAIGLVIDPGSTLVNSGGNLSAITLNNGTLVVDSGAGNILGALSGSGTLDVNDSTVATSSVTQGLTTIGPGAHLGANGAVTSDVQLEGIGANILLDTGANSYTGNITATGASGTGAVFITDDGNARTINGNLGTASSTLASLSMGADAATATVIDLKGNAYVDQIILGENDVLRFSGSGNQTVSGTIVATNDNAGTIGIGDGILAPTVTFNGVIGGNNNWNTLFIDVGSHAIFNADVILDDTFRAPDSTVTIGSNTTITASVQNDADATAWNIGVSPTDVGQVVFTSDGVDLSNDSVNFLVDGSLAGVATLDDVFTGNTAAITAGAVVTDNSFLYDFSLVDDGNTVDAAVMVVNTIADTVENPGFAEAGEILLTGALSSSTNPEIIQLQAAIGAQSTQEGVSKTIEAVTSPNIDGGALAAGLALANQTANLNSQRLASLRDGVETAASSTGLSSGNAAEGLSVWTQGFGAVGDQDDRGGVSGYDMTGFGLAFGADKQIFDETAVVGLAVAYAHTQVDSLGTANAETTIDSYQIALYGDYDLSDRTYIAGQVNYVWSTNDTTRNPGGVSSLSASGDYDSSQIGARVEVGHDFALGDLVLTPKALANYVYYDAGGYSETGAGGANLTVDSDAVNLFELGLGVDAAWDIETSDGGRILPVLSAGLRHDFVGDNIQASNRFQAGGPAFRVEGSDPAQTTFNIGAAISYLESEHWEVTADYDFEAKSGYQSHNGFIRVAYRF